MVFFLLKRHLKFNPRSLVPARRVRRGIAPRHELSGVKNFERLGFQDDHLSFPVAREDMVPEKSLLVRDFIHEHLYMESKGYFANPVGVIGSIANGAPLRNGTEQLRQQLQQEQMENENGLEKQQQVGKQQIVTKSSFQHENYHLGFTELGAQPVSNSKNQSTLTPEPGTENWIASLKGEEEYKSAIAKAYRTGKGWLTPCEIFAPHYSRAIANAIAADFRKRHLSPNSTPSSATARIIEVGGGRGTNAKHFMDHLRNAHPDVYAHTQFEAHEISPHLASLQKLALSSHLDRSKVLVRDFARDHPPAPSSDLSEQPTETYILFLEVLDNLPHDRVVNNEGVLYETHVDLFKDDSTGRPFVEERLEHLQDPDIISAMNAAASLDWSEKGLLHQSHTRLGDGLRSLMANLPAWAQSSTSVKWVNTGALLLVETLHRRYPGHRVIMADFSHLRSSVRGDNAPLVQRLDRETGVMHTFETYRVPVIGLCDIFL